MSAVTTYFVYCGDGGMSVEDVNTLTAVSYTHLTLPTNREV